jgi:hypothetical protein
MKMKMYEVGWRFHDDDCNIETKVFKTEKAARNFINGDLYKAFLAAPDYYGMRMQNARESAEMDGVPLTPERYMQEMEECMLMYLEETEVN